MASSYFDKLSMRGMPVTNSDPDVRKRNRQTELVTHKKWPHPEFVDHPSPAKAGYATAGGRGAGPQQNQMGKRATPPATAAG